MPSIQTQSASPERGLATDDPRRLQRRSASVSFEVQSEGLGDPFAELFAAIATAEPSIPVDSGPNQTVEQEAPSSQVDQDDQSSEDFPSNDVTPETALGPLPAEHQETIDTGEVQAVQSEDNPGPVKETDQPLETLQETEAIRTEDSAVAEAEIVEVESKIEAPAQNEIQPSETDTTELGAAVATNQSSEKKRGNRDSSNAATVVPVSAKREDVAKNGSPSTEEAVPSTAEAELGFTNPDREQGNQRDRASSTRDSRHQRHQGAPADNIIPENAGRPSGQVGSEFRSAVQVPSSTDTSIRPTESLSSSNGADRISAPISGVVGETRVRNASISQRNDSGAVSKTSGAEKNASLNRLLDSPSNRTATTGDPAKSKAKPSSAADLVMKAKLVQRVSKAFQHFGNENGNIRLKLAPAELGSVRVEMQVREKQVHARVVADNESAAQLLREQLPELRGRLEAQGMQVDRLTVEQESDTTFASNGDPGNEGDANRWANQDAHQRRDRNGARSTPTNSPNHSSDSKLDPRAVSQTRSTGIQTQAGVDVLY